MRILKYADKANTREIYYYIFNCNGYIMTIDYYKSI